MNYVVEKSDTGTALTPVFFTFGPKWGDDRLPGGFENAVDTYMVILEPDEGETADIGLLLDKS